MDNLRTFLCIYEANGFIRNCVFDPGQDYIDHCNEMGYTFAVVNGTAPSGIHDAYWFDGTGIVPRPDNSATIRGENRTVFIENVSEGSQIFAIVEGVEIPVDDHEIEVDEPGRIGVRIVSPWPMKEARFDVQVE